MLKLKTAWKRISSFQAALIAYYFLSKKDMASIPLNAAAIRKI
ncbi:hypothetical protein [Paenibacillus sp. L3-i20]|nr:hypothetical protein [Paenibacillus sp. L3-i20]